MGEVRYELVNLLPQSPEHYAASPDNEVKREAMRIRYVDPLCVRYSQQSMAHVSYRFDCSNDRIRSDGNSASLADRSGFLEEDQPGSSGMLNRREHTIC